MKDMTRLMRFSVAGAMAFIVDSAVLVVCTELFGVNPFIARIPGLLAGVSLIGWIDCAWIGRKSATTALLGQRLKHLLAIKAGASVNFGVYALALVLSNTIYLYPALGVALGSMAGLAVHYRLVRRLIPVHETAGPNHSNPGMPFDRQGLWILVGCMPIGFGFLSLLRGQDRNWDLLNYHLYVPFAWIEGRHGIDLAAAQMQSYFPPLIDLPYFLLIQALPGPAVAFLMGLLHGLVFIPLFAIARQFVGPRTAFYLSLGGCLGSAWLSGLGTTMGDSLAATGVILSFLLLLPLMHSDSGKADQPLLWLTGSGLLLGLFVGLKITNGIFALALLLAFFLSYPGSWKSRIAFVLVLGLSALIGLLASAGYWFQFLWTEFGNPLFPQFNQWFGAPLASATGIIDQTRLPESAIQAMLWPVRLLTDPDHFSEVGQRSLVWLVLVPVSAGLAIQQFVARSMGKTCAQVTAAERFLLIFILAGFVLWIFTFSIFRYLVALELLAPLAIWVAIGRAMPRRISRPLNPAILGLVVLVALVGTQSWGHSRLSWSAIDVEVPDLNHPEQRVLVLVGDQPQSWRLPWWPPEVAFIGLAGNFPENDNFKTQALARLRSRAGPHMVMIPAARDRGEARLLAANQWLAIRQIAARGRLCRFLDGLASEHELELTMRPLSNSGRQIDVCQFASTKAEEQTKEMARQNQDIAHRNADLLLAYGVMLELDSCQVFDSRIGGESLPYQVCEITLAGH